MVKNFKPLRLLAQDSKDLEVLSAHLQDALLPLSAMVYEPKNETFTILANRFCWEHHPVNHENEPMYHRIHSGLHFKNVENVHYQGFHRQGETQMLNFLTLKANEDSIQLVCAEGNDIRIQTKNFHCQLGDVHQPWPTRKKPMHIHEHITGLKKQS